MTYSVALGILIFFKKGNMIESTLKAYSVLYVVKCSMYMYVSA